MGVESVRNVGTAGYTASFCANHEVKEGGNKNILERTPNEDAYIKKSHTGRNIVIGTVATVGLATAADFIFAKGKHIKQLLKFGEKESKNISKNIETHEVSELPVDKNRISGCFEDIIDKGNVLKFTQTIDGKGGSKISRSVFTDGSRVDYITPPKTSMANNYSELYNAKDVLIEKTIYAVDGKTPIKKFIYDVNGKVIKSQEKGNGYIIES